MTTTACVTPRGQCSRTRFGAAVLNAVLDAVAHLGIEHLDMPLSLEKLWRAIQEAPPK